MPETGNQSLARYLRQTIFSGLGEAGQRRLLAARVAIIGCGATGTVIANHLARAGVGYLRIVDRDYIELNNLQRQLLFDEEDMRQGLPKAAAAAIKLRRINSEIEIEAVVTDVNPGNVVQLVPSSATSLNWRVPSDTCTVTGVGPMSCPSTTTR